MGHSRPPLRALPVSPQLVCVSSRLRCTCSSALKIIAFSIQDHGGSSGKLCLELGNLLAGFNVIYSLGRVFEHL